MGFFSKLKNSFTGSWADVNIETNEPFRGEELDIKVKIDVKDDDIEINGVYLKVECSESIYIDDYEVSRDKLSTTNTNESEFGQNVGDRREERDDRDSLNQNLVKIDINKSHSHLREDRVIAEAQTLQANQSYTFEHKIQILDTMPPTFEGKFSKIKWLVYAGVDMKGNDPDSGWKSVVVK